MITPPARKARLIQLWDAGTPASAIAQRLGMTVASVRQMGFKYGTKREPGHYELQDQFLPGSD